MNKQFYSLFCLFFLINAQLLSEEVDVVDNSGSERIANIMSKVKHNVVPGQENSILYTQVTNIDKDLNLQALVDVLSPKTVMGKAYLHEILQCPVSPADETGIVQLRQNIIRQLVENPDFKVQVEAMLQSAYEQEQDAQELLSSRFIGKTCPELQILEVLKKENYFAYSINQYFYTNPTGKMIFMGLNGATLATYGCLSAFLAYSAAQKAKLGLSFVEEVYYSSLCGLLTGLYAYTIYDECTKAGMKRAKIHALNQLIHIAENLEALSLKNNVQTQFKMSLITDQEGIALVDALKAARYEHKTDYCFNVPAVHTFLYKLYQNDDQLAQVFASIAEMDAYNAIATKMIEAQNSPRQFCFAQLIESAQPAIVSENFWNILVPNAVTNSLLQNQHVILTGPNAGGKTTSIRAILQNIVLAQTLGVAAASHFEYTPFDTLLSYLNVSDDLLNGLSLFASEVKRAQEILAIIKALPQDHKLFFALDELFTGTAAEAGEKIAYDFIKKVAEYNQTLFIYATHFDLLKELGRENVGLMNYKVDAPTKNSEGKLVYPFTLSAGANTVNIAMDMAKEANLFA